MRDRHHYTGINSSRSSNERLCRRWKLKTVRLDQREEEIDLSRPPSLILLTLNTDHHLYSYVRIMRELNLMTKWFSHFTPTWRSKIFLNFLSFHSFHHRSYNSRTQIPIHFCQWFRTKIITFPWCSQYHEIWRVNSLDMAERTKCGNELCGYLISPFHQLIIH